MPLSLGALDRERVLYVRLFESRTDSACSRGEAQDGHPLDTQNRRPDMLSEDPTQHDMSWRSRRAVDDVADKASYGLYAYRSSFIGNTVRRGMLAFLNVEIDCKLFGYCVQPAPTSEGGAKGKPRGARRGQCLAATGSTTADMTGR